MCNAWNHSPECTCGWGGYGHLGRRGPDPNQSLPVSVPYRFNHFYLTASSFTNPNAHCPVCGANVFFYQSPYGGKVYFDELGPPWPRHPCTDNTPIGSISRVAETVSHAFPLVSTPANPKWMDDGWQPFFCQKVTQATKGVGYCRLDGYIGDRCITLYLCATRLPDAALVHVKSTHINEYDVSLLWEESGTNRFGTEIFKAFFNPLEAVAWCARKTASKSHLLRTHKHARSRTSAKSQASKKQNKAPAGKSLGNNKSASTASFKAMSRQNQTRKLHKTDKPPSPKEPQLTSMELAFIRAREGKSKN